MQRPLIDYIRRPDIIDDEAISQLQTLIQEHPYFHVARILLLQALYKKHDPAYDETLRRTAVLVPCREAVFRLTEEPHYTHAEEHKRYDDAADSSASRTVSLIDNFLESIPKEEEIKEGKDEPRRKPTPADAAVDYVAYLLESETDNDATDDVPQLIGQDLIDSFINNDKGKIVLSETPTLAPQLEKDEEKTEEEPPEGYFTETLARIYIKQGRYLKAYEIIQRLSLQYPKKNAYFADQMRFLEKLIINNNKNKQ